MTGPLPYLDWGRRVLGGVADALLPQLCLACGTAIGSGGAVCPACWNTLRFIAPPLCVGCGLPFDFDGADSICGDCARAWPNFAPARAALRYDDASKKLILGFKHGDRIHAARAFAAWMTRAGAELIENCDVIVPVPLHWRRLALRRYNQAAELARAIVKLTDRRYAPLALKRVRATQPQGGFGRAARARNVAGAFVVPPRQRDAVAGRRVLLIDDVVTTGATAAACARSLFKAGAKSVNLLALARVSRVDAGAAWDQPLPNGGERS